MLFELRHFRIKNCFLNKIVLYLNDQKIDRLSQGKLLLW